MARDRRALDRIRREDQKNRDPMFLIRDMAQMLSLYPYLGEKGGLGARCDVCGGTWQPTTRREGPERDADFDWGTSMLWHDEACELCSLIRRADALGVPLEGQRSELTGELED